MMDGAYEWMRDFLWTAMTASVIRTIAPGGRMKKAVGFAAGILLLRCCVTGICRLLE